MNRKPFKLLCLFLATVVCTSLFTACRKEKSPEAFKATETEEISIQEERVPGENIPKYYTCDDVIRGMNVFLKSKDNPNVEFEENKINEYGNKTYLGTCFGGSVIIAMTEQNEILSHITVSTPMYTEKDGALYTEKSEIENALYLLLFFTCSYLPKEQQTTVYKALMANAVYEDSAISSEYADGTWGYTLTIDPWIMLINVDRLDSDFAEKHEHSFTEYKGKAATCTENGYADYQTCSCGYSTYSSISALGHSHSLIESKDPTCDTEGYKMYQCIRCSDSYKTNMAAKGHNYTEATCTAPKTCSVCKHTEGSPLSHNMEYTKCTRCDYSDFSSIAKTYNKFAYDSWYYLGDRYSPTDGRYLEEGEASMSISKDGICNVIFAEYSYSFTLVQSECDSYGIHFDCYINGEYLENAEVWCFFDQNRCEFSLKSGTLGFSQVCLSFAKN